MNFAEYDIEDGALSVVKEGFLGEGCGKDYVGRVEVMFDEQGHPTFSPMVKHVYIPIFEVAMNPTALKHTVSDDVMKARGQDAMWLELQRKARELQMFGHGCEVVCLYRQRMTTLPADSGTRRGFVVFCLVAMFGVSSCLVALDERRGLK